MTEVLLDSIVSPGFGKLVFNKSTDFLSGHYGVRLNSVDKINVNKELISSTNFYYQYPITSNNSSGLPSGVPTSTTRVFLDSLVVKDRSSYRVQGYSFDYESLSSLPVRLSYAKDHWGYFNGASNSTSIPDVIPTARKTYFPTLSWANRNPNYNYSKIGMLKKITYPTGGYTQINYEANKVNETTEVGGVRVSQTTTYPIIGAPSMIKKYQYSGGQSGSDLTTSYYSEYNVYVYSAPNCGAAVVNTIPVYKASNWTHYSMGKYGGGSVGYATVKILNGLNGEDGFEEHQFTVAFDTPGGPTMLGSNIIPDRTYSNFGWNNGEKQRDIYYNSSSTKIKDVIYSYTSDLTNEKTNYFVSLRKTGPLTGAGHLIDYCSCGYSGIITDPTYNYPFINQDFDAYAYFFTSKWRYLSFKTETNYDVNGQNPVATTTNFYYEVPGHAQMTLEEMRDSKGNFFRKRYYYTADCDTTVMNFLTLKSKHIISQPVDIRKYDNGLLAEGQQIKYNDYGQPTDLYVAETNGSDVSFTPSNPYRFSHKVNYQYDSNNNLIQASKDYNIPTTYLWSYNGSMPVVKAENVTNTVLTAAVIAAGASNVETFWRGFNNIATDASQQTAWKNFNSALRNNSTLLNAKVSTYTYAPLIGMTSQTDPNGVTTYYEYDPMERLKNVRDKDLYILGRNYYHYYSDASSDAATLNVSQSTISSVYTATSTPLAITANCSWTITSNSPSWLSVNTASGNLSGSVNVIATGNTGVLRTGILTVTYGRSQTKTVTVTQAANTTTLITDQIYLAFPRRATTINVAITSNTTWTAAVSSGAVSWLRVSNVSGSGNATLGVQTLSDIGSGSRGGYVTIATTDGLKSVQINVLQSY